LQANKNNIPVGLPAYDAAQAHELQEKSGLFWQKNNFCY